MTTCDEWFTCRCGKTWSHPVRQETPELRAAYRKIVALSPCHSCEMDAAKERDECPEIVPIEGGVSSCGLTWQHTGRCQPYAFPAELRASLLATYEKRRRT